MSASVPKLKMPALADDDVQPAELGHASSTAAFTAP